MSWLILALTILHYLICLFLILVVLLQSGKAADLAGAFGGMGSQTAFGPRGSATVLSKATTIAAVLFMVTSMSLSVLSTRSTGAGSTVLEKHQVTPPPKPPAGAPAGQPTVTISPEGGGAGQTIPIDIGPPPGAGQPAAPQKK